jgi:chromosome segregation ATPase
MAGERFNREAGKPRLAEAPRADSALDTEVETSELLTRLERQAAESGRLEGQAETLERAAKALHDRAEHDRAARATAEEELERARHGFSVSEQQLQMSWARLMQAEEELARRDRPLWRRLLRQPPAS